MKHIKPITLGFLLLLGILYVSPVGVGVKAQTTPELPPSPFNGTYTRVNVSYGTPVAIAPNESVELVTPTGMSVKLIPGDSLEITMNETSENPAGQIQNGLVSLDIFLQIEANDTTVDVDATIGIAYNESMLNGINETDLEVRFFNDTTGIWDLVPSWVNASENVVYGNTTHFSTWTVTAQNETQPPSDPLPPSPPPINGSEGRVNVTYGKPVAVQPGQKVELVTPSGIKISMTPAEGVEVTVDQFSENPAGPVQSGLQSLGVYLQIEVNDTSVEINATIAMQYNETTLNGTDPSTLELRFFNASTGLWEAVPSWVDFENMTVYGNTTHFSTWTATGAEPEQQPGEPVPTPPPVAKPGVPFEITPGKPVAIRPGERVELVTPSGISINVVPASGVEITIDELTTNPGSELPSGLKSIGVYLDIKLNDSSVEINATLSLPLDKVDGLSLSSLEFRYYDEGSDAWQAVPSWVEGNYIYANTTHFSIWTVTGSDGTSDVSTSESSSTTEATFFPILVLGIALLPITYFRKKEN